MLVDTPTMKDGPASVTAGAIPEMPLTRIFPGGNMPTREI